MSARTAIGAALIVGGGGFLLYKLLSGRSLAETLQAPLELKSNDPVTPVAVPIGPAITALPSGPSVGPIPAGSPLDKINAASVSAIANAIRLTESGSNPFQVSSKGAVGAMQLLPNTAKAVAASISMRYDPDLLLNDPMYNVQLGSAYLGQLLSRFGGNKIAAVTAYFAGPTSVGSWINRFGTPNVSLSAAAWLTKIGKIGNPKSAQYAFTVASHL